MSVDIKQRKNECSIIQKICAPILETFNLNYFGYCRTNMNATILNLSTDHNWLNYSDQLEPSQCIIGAPSSYFKKIVNLADCQQGSPFHLTILTPLQQRFGYHHNFVIKQPHLTYCEWYHFAAPKENDTLEETLHIYSKYFDRFINYFNHQAYPIIKQFKKKNLKFFNNIAQLETQVLKAISPKIDDSALEKFKIKTIPTRFYFDSKQASHITKREYECLYWLAQGYSYKEIGRKLQIAEKTVQEHMDSCRYKLAVNNKNELIKFIANNKGSSINEFKKKISDVCSISRAVITQDKTYEAEIAAIWD